MTTLNFPQSLYSDRGVEGGNIYRKLYVFYKDTQAGPVKKKVFDIILNKRITLSISADNASITIEENSSPMTNPLVTSTIRFETNSGDDPNQGRIEGGLFFNKDNTNPNCNCITSIEGFEYDKDNDKINPTSYPLFVASQNELILSIIGVDDIRAKTDGNYNETYSLEEQELSFMLKPIGAGPNLDILIEYKSLNPL